MTTQTARADVSVFPLLHSQNGPTTEGLSLWAPWPLVESTSTTETQTFGLHPLFSWWKNNVSGESAVHVVWPLIRRTFRPSSFRGDEWTVFYIFPVLYFGKGEQEGQPTITRYILPVYYQGRQGKTSSHLIIFPFFWYARDASLYWPLFPQRPQTFFAIWPLYGDFRGYWGRDRIQFALWPLAVVSEKGKGNEKFTVRSFVWPFTAVYSGEKYRGFRFWPLFNYVEKKDEFVRSYWLWPLGHHRTGLVGDTKTTQTLTAFLPFYAHNRNREFDYDLLFPLYGMFHSGKKTSRGYVLAIYNHTDDLRSYTREHRLLWFLIRWKTIIPPETVADEQAMNYSDETSSDSLTGRKKEKEEETGWAFFPFYGKKESESKRSLFVLWPIFIQKWDKSKEFEFDRTYLVPFYSTRERRWSDGAVSRSTFILPFFKSSSLRDGSQHKHWFHLWWYESVDGLDRNYAPLWTFYENNWNEKTGVEHKQVLKRLWESERRRDGSTKTSFNFLLFSGESSPEASEASFAWGLLGYRRDQDQTRVQLFWFLKI